MKRLSVEGVFFLFFVLFFLFRPSLLEIMVINTENHNIFSNHKFDICMYIHGTICILTLETAIACEIRSNDLMPVSFPISHWHVVTNTYSRYIYRTSYVAKHVNYVKYFYF